MFNNISDPSFNETEEVFNEDIENVPGSTLNSKTTSGKLTKRNIKLIISYKSKLEKQYINI